MEVKGLERPFIVVGENAHCTRVLLRKGKRIGQTPDGEEAILWSDPEGRMRYLVLSEQTKKTSDYSEGRVKHVQIAVKAAMAGGDGASDGLEYLQHLIQQQVEAGVDFLDLNVDEISFKHEEQQAAMKWLVRTVGSMTDVPLSVDSSLMETIEAGMIALDPRAGRPLLNSASLERKEALNLAVRHNTHVIITGAGESGMPENTEQRVANASRMIDMATEKGIPLSDIQVDLLVFPIAVDGQFGLHYLDAVREIRNRYGPDIHITGGMSNVSFGIPARRLVNDVFVNLVIEYGADAGILDPVTRDIEGIISMDRDAPGYHLARQMLLGEDRNCKSFLRAYRKGEFGLG